MTGAHCADGAVPGRLATTSANSTASDSVPVNERPFQEMYHQSVKVNTPWQLGIGRGHILRSEIGAKGYNHDLQKMPSVAA